MTSANCPFEETARPEESLWREPQPKARFAGASFPKEPNIVKSFVFNLTWCRPAVLHYSTKFIRSKSVKPRWCEGALKGAKFIV